MRINSLILDRTKLPHQQYSEFDDIPFKTLSESLDLKIFTDPEILKKYKKYGNQKGLKINFVLCEYTSFPIDKDHEKNTKSVINKYSKLNSPESATVIFFGNFGSNYLPFTPWILFHRSWHAIVMSKLRLGLLFTSWDGANDPSGHLKLLMKELYPFYKKELGRSSSEFLNCDYEVGICKECPPFFSWIFKFKSARSGAYLKDIDVMAELFAQYATTGKITLTRNLPDFLSDPEKTEVIKIHKKYESLLTNYFVDIEKKLIGKTFSF